MAIESLVGGRLLLIKPVPAGWTMQQFPHTDGAYEVEIAAASRKQAK
ncbi:hypothetical protein [Andreprevotia lacus]|jgi:hypothetical protein|nr:hypothetical protein [Andreprevotia lacus]